MLTQEQRTAFGKSVKDIARHYFVGLEGISIDDAQKEFEQQLNRGDPLAVSALRLAEREIFSRIDK